MRKNLAFFAGLALAASALWANVKLENDRLAVEFDDFGNLTSLKKQNNGRKLCGRAGALARNLHAERTS